jgi:hypothetical protein
VLVVDVVGALPVVDVGAAVVVTGATFVTVLVVLVPHEASTNTSIGTTPTVRTRVTMQDHMPPAGSSPGWLVA